MERGTVRPAAAGRDAPAAVPRPRQLSPPAAGAACIPWPELTGAAEQLESGSHTGRDLKLTSSNEVTALESTNHPRQLDGARGTTTLLGDRVPPPAPGTVLLSPGRWVSHSKFPRAPGCRSGWSYCCFCLHPLAGAGSGAPQLPLTQLAGHICVPAGDTMEEERWPPGRWPQGCVAQPQLGGHQPPLISSPLTSPNAFWGWDEEHSSQPSIHPSIHPSIQSAAARNILANCLTTSLFLGIPQLHFPFLSADTRFCLSFQRYA